MPACSSCSRRAGSAPSSRPDPSRAGYPAKPAGIMLAPRFGAAPMNVLARPSHQLHETRLDRLASVAVQVGLGLAPGQELVLTAPLDAAPLVRLITEHAYKAGAKLVTVIYSDEASTL